MGGGGAGVLDPTPGKSQVAIGFRRNPEGPIAFEGGSYGHL